HEIDVSSDNYWVMKRVPCSYLGVATGLQIRQYQSGRTHFLRGRPDPPAPGGGAPIEYQGADGVLYGIHHTEDLSDKGVQIRQIEDGTSNTAMVGEAIHDVQNQESYGTTAESQAGNRQDHWWGGSDDIDTEPSRDLSEMLGSTGVPPYMQYNPDL